MQRAISRSGQAVLGSPVHMMTGRRCSSLRYLSLLKSQLCWTEQLLKGAETHFSPWGGAVPRGVRHVRWTYWIISHILRLLPSKEMTLISLQISRCAYLLNGSRLLKGWLWNTWMDNYVIIQHHKSIKRYKLICAVSIIIKSSHIILWFLLL